MSSLSRVNSVMTETITAAALQSIFEAVLCKAVIWDYAHALLEAVYLRETRVKCCFLQIILSVRLCVPTT